MTWFWLAIAAYWIGQVISMVEIRARHSDWPLIPCAVMALAWPYFVGLRCIALLRASRRRR